MYWLDTLLLVLLGLGAVLGFMSGLLWQVARIVTLAAALMATIACNEPATHFCREQVLREADPRISQAVAYVLVFLAVYLILFLATRLLYQCIKATKLQTADRLLGALFGTGKAALV